MFDNLRQEASASPFFTEEEKPIEEPRRRSALDRLSNSGRILGMTGPQRFVIALELLLAVCILGSMALLAFDKFGI